MKTTSIRNCQSCGKILFSGEKVFFAPFIKEIVCFDCAAPHPDRQERIVEDDGEGFIQHDQRLENLITFLKSNNIKLTDGQFALLEWISRWGMETYTDFTGLLGKCLKVGGKDE